MKPMDSASKIGPEFACSKKLLVSLAIIVDYHAILFRNLDDIRVPESNSEPPNYATN